MPVEGEVAITLAFAAFGCALPRARIPSIGIPSRISCAADAITYRDFVAGLLLPGFLYLTLSSLGVGDREPRFLRTCSRRGLGRETRGQDK